MQQRFPKIAASLGSLLYVLHTASRKLLGIAELVVQLCKAAGTANPVLSATGVSLVLAFLEDLAQTRRIGGLSVSS